MEYYRQLKMTFLDSEYSGIKEEKVSRAMTQEEKEEYDELTADLDQISLFSLFDCMNS